MVRLSSSRWILSVVGAVGCSVAAEREAVEPSVQAAALADSTAPPMSVEDAEERPVAAIESPWDPLLREIAASHASWGLVDNQFHWAPGLCAMPAEGVQHLSAADADTAHAAKVFVLHALDPKAYWRSADVKGELPATLDRVGATLRSRDDVLQVLVKESFVPRPLDADTFQARLVPAKRGDARYGAGDPIGLFVMAQLRDATSEGTDAGWIYATIAPEGRITAAGDLEACRGCHGAQADRVFGMPLQWK